MHITDKIIDMIKQLITSPTWLLSLAMYNMSMFAASLQLHTASAWSVLQLLVAILCTYTAVAEIQYRARQSEE